jgi:hypothetical protein
MNWSDWIKTIHTQPNEVPSLLQRHLALAPMEDSAQAKALIQAMQNRDDELFFLHGEENDEELVVFQVNDDWHACRWTGETAEESDLALFINYSRQLSRAIKQFDRDPEVGDYYSLRPLIYGGHYWLESVCGDEVNRFQELESDELAVLLVPWQSGDSLFELVESLRRGDRIGYFENLLGVLLPFTSAREAGAIKNRLEERFEPEQFEVWQYNDDFNNHFELKTKVEEVL